MLRLVSIQTFCTVWLVRPPVSSRSSPGQRLSRADRPVYRIDNVPVRTKGSGPMFRNQKVQPADSAGGGEGPLVCPRSAGCTSPHPLPCAQLSAQTLDGRFGACSPAVNGSTVASGSCGAQLNSSGARGGRRAMNSRRTHYSRFEVMTEGRPAWAADDRGSVFYYDGLRFWRPARGGRSKVTPSWRSPPFGWAHDADCSCRLCGAEAQRGQEAA